MRQVAAFLKGEGRAWVKRNADKLTGENDPVMEQLHFNSIMPKRVLEVGCANGWRLQNLYNEFGCDVWGVDPGIGWLTYRAIILGAAHDLHQLKKDSFDLVIYGWCLYLCDPEDYFQIAAEGDRVLEDGGFLVIHDFYSSIPYKNRYKHKDGLFSHKMDFSKLWLSHPAYSLYSQAYYGAGDDTTTVVILKKNMKNAFPVNK